MQGQVSARYLGSARPRRDTGANAARSSKQWAATAAAVSLPLVAVGALSALFG